jgi:hypothetical protein
LVHPFDGQTRCKGARRQGPAVAEIEQMDSPGPVNGVERAGAP